MHRLVLFTLLAACTEAQPEPHDTDPHDTDEPDTDEPDTDTDEPAPDAIQTEEQGDGSFVTTVDASSPTDWIHMSLRTGEQVITADPANDGRWDLAFRRSEVATNGGVTGVGGVIAARLTGIALDELTEAPDGGWRADARVDDATRYALGDWYDYDLATHTLTPADHVYVVRAGDGSHYAVRFLGYYADDAAGHPSFQWKPVDGPRGALAHTDHGDGTGSVTVDASDNEAWVYVDLRNLRAVDPVVPEDDRSWDLAFRRTGLRLNGGASGRGGAEVVRLDGVPLEEVTEVPDAGWTSDALDDEGAPVYALGDWYVYDFVTHRIEPADASWVLRAVDGTHYALRFTGYYDAQGASGHVGFTMAPLAAP